MHPLFLPLFTLKFVSCLRRLSLLRRPASRSNEKIALPFLMTLDIGLHELAQHVRRPPVFFLADRHKCFAQVFLYSDTDAGVFHGASLAYGYTFVYPILSLLPSQNSYSSKLSIMSINRSGAGQS